MYTKKEREYYNQDRDKACKRLNITLSQYNYLRLKGEALRQVYENDCNEIYKTEEENNLAENKIKMKIWQYRLKNINLKALKWFYQTDPRGATIYLDTEEISESNYNQAVCIY